MVKQMKNFLVNAILILTLGLLCLEELQAYKNIPSYVPRCHRLDPKLNECLLKATETMKPYLIKGVTEFSFPPLENFSIPEVTLKQGSDALNFMASLKNIRIRGLSNYKFSKYDYDVPNNLFTCIATISPLTLDGQFSVEGRLLVAPIHGEGNFTAGIDSVTVNLTQKITQIKKEDGEYYVHPVYTNSQIRVSGPKAKISGLFSGSQEINDITNKVIADNADVLFEELRPVVEKVVTRLIQDLAFKGFEDAVPYRILYESAPLPEP